MRGQLVQTVAPILVNHLRGVEGQLLVGVDADQHGGHPGLEEKLKFK